ncbi:subtilisin-like protein [Trametes maxima]|nr:subtilisin-like protein [Trametes maxima]
MALIAFWVLALALSPLIFAEPSLGTGTTQYHETRSSIPTGFKLLGSADPAQSLTLTFGLAQNDEEGLIDALYDVSDPASPNYGRHLSKAEVETFVAPKPAAVDAPVNAWFAKNNMTDSVPLSPTGDWVEFSISVEQASELFSANFSKFKDARGGGEMVRTMAYALPEELQGHVAFVHPMVSFDSPAGFGSSKRVFDHATPGVANGDTPPACVNGTTPGCLQFIYGIPAVPAVNKDNQLGVTGMQGGVAGYSFLETFLETYRPDIDPATNFTVVGIDGGSNNQSLPSISEGNLDIQYTVGVATGVPIVYVFVGTQNQDGPFRGWLDEVNYLLAQENPPKVMTTSWGAFQESSFSQPVTERLCQAYAQLGARGVSFLVASLDEGVGCSPTNGSNFEATFPSNCPYVTSVGGTDNYTPETAWFASSGGFTNYFPRAPNQSSAVGAYLAQHGGPDSANAGRYNASGRGFPDVALHATQYPVFEAGEWFLLEGTSAASPVLASMIALANDRLRSAGRPPMGWLNPLLYSQRGREVVGDVVEGNSSVVCADSEGDSEAPRGFEAVRGWDPVTGLGTITFEGLLALAGL